MEAPVILAAENPHNERHGGRSNFHFDHLVGTPK